MATGDKLIKLDAFKAVYDEQNSNIAPTEASSTASAAHAAGSYFFYGGKLYRATADIASGGTITPNTNCVAVTAGAEISELKSDLTQAVTPTWINGNYSDGNFSASTTRATLSKLVSVVDGFQSISVPSAYEFCVLAWDSVGDYKGVLRTTDQFSISGTTKWVKSFSLRDFPAYSFNVLARNANNTSATITSSDWNNFVVIGSRFVAREVEKTSIIRAESGWFIGGALQNGFEIPYSNYMTLKRRVSYNDGIIKVSVPVKYKFAVGAWENGTYIGVLRASGSFDSSGTVRYLSEFNLENFPKTYEFNISIQNAISAQTGIDSADIPNFLVYRFNNDGIIQLDTSGDWVQGYLGDGVIKSSSIRICKYTPVSFKDGYTSFSVGAGYKFYIAAWERDTKKYLGIYKNDETFKTSGGATQYVVNFQIDAYPDYEFRFTIEAVDGSTITPTAATNANLFRDNVAKNSIVIDEYGTETNNRIGTFNSIKSVSRLGYGTNDLGFPPENSIAGYKMAYIHGFRTMLCDVTFTSDHVPVCLHDESINRVARNTDGTEISSTVNISDITLEQADTYDFGLWKGEAFAGLKIMRLDEFIQWCKLLGCEPYLEIKNWVGTKISDDNLNAMCAVLDKYNMGNKCSFIIDQDGTLTKVHTKYPMAGIGIVTTASSDFESAAEKLLTVKDNNHVFFGIWISNTMTGNVSQACKTQCLTNGIGLYLSEIRDYSEYQTFMTDADNLFADSVAIRYKTFDEYARESLL